METLFKVATKQFPFAQQVVTRPETEFLRESLFAFDNLGIYKLNETQ